MSDRCSLLNPSGEEECISDFSEKQLWELSIKYSVTLIRLWNGQLKVKASVPHWYMVVSFYKEATEYPDLQCTMIVDYWSSLVIFVASESLIQSDFLNIGMNTSTDAVVESLKWVSAGWPKNSALLTFRPCSDTLTLGAQASEQSGSGTTFGIWRGSSRKLCLEKWLLEGSAINTWIFSSSFAGEINARKAASWREIQK